jgi:hypothetical protein
MHKSKSIFNCKGAGTGEPGALKGASPGSGRDGQKRSGNRTSLAVYSTTSCIGISILKLHSWSLNEKRSHERRKRALGQGVSHNRSVRNPPRPATVEALAFKARVLHTKG